MSNFDSLKIPARDIPIPKSISPAAQAALAAFAAHNREPYPAPADREAWAGYAARAEEGLLAISLFKDVEERATATEVGLGGARGYLALPRAGGDGDGRILYDLHGGGLVTGGGKICRLTTMRAASTFKAKAYGVDYRMPPLHPYPTPLEDCMAGYRFLLSRYRPEQILVQGGSSGGNLAAALMLRIRKEGVPFPAGLILVTPELDLTESGDSFRTLEGVDVVLKTSLMNANLLYADGHDLTEPELSPLFGDFSAGFPPTLLTAGTRDLFLSNAVRMHNALRRSGNHSELLIEEAMPHGGFFGAPEDIALNADMVDFANRVWEGKLRR